MENMCKKAMSFYYGTESLSTCVCKLPDVCVPEIRCRGPFQGEASQVHSSVHQQEENGHNAGDGVELP